MRTMRREVPGEACGSRRAPEARLLIAALLASGVLAASPVRADGAAEAYAAMGIRTKDVITGSVLSARVVPGEGKQVVAVTTYFTGKKDASGAVNVRLDVFRRDGGSLVSVLTRDFGGEDGGFVARGELEVVDLDGDGVSEILVSYDDLRSAVVSRRRGQVLVHDPEGFRTAWSGDLAYDATRAAREVPPERRDRFTRKIDIPATLRTRGISLVVTRTVLAVAGERLSAPSVSKEVFPLRLPAAP